MSTFLNDEIFNKLITKFWMIKYKNFIISKVYVNLQSNKNCAYLKIWHWKLRIVPVKVPQDFQAQSKNFSGLDIAELVSKMTKMRISHDFTHAKTVILDYIQDFFRIFVPFVIRLTQGHESYSQNNYFNLTKAFILLHSNDVTKLFK